MDNVIKTPCVRMCTLNKADMCLGCGRQLSEITSWSSFTSEQRNTIMDDCKARLEANKTSAFPSNKE